MHFPCIRTSFQDTWYIWNCLGLFWLSFLSLPLFLFTLVLSMAPKRKSTPTLNPLHSGASSSFDSAPLSLWFRDDDACKAFLENFSRRGIHSECQVVLSDFADTDLPSVIHSRGWESLRDVPVTCPLVLIQEFYSNMHGIDRSVPLFFSRVRGTRIPITPQLVANVTPRIPVCAFLSHSTLCHSWQKGGVVLDMRVVTLRERVSFWDHFVRRSVVIIFLRDVVRILWIFSFLSLLDTLFLYMRSCDHL